MNKKVGTFIQEVKSRQLLNFDFHDFVEMNEEGLSEEEIATELGVTPKYVEDIKNQMKKDY